MNKRRRLLVRDNKLLLNSILLELKRLTTLLVLINNGIQTTSQSAAYSQKIRLFRNILKCYLIKFLKILIYIEVK